MAFGSNIVCDTAGGLSDFELEDNQAIQDAMDPSARHLAENSRFKEITDLMGKVLGSRAIAETELTHLIRENPEITRITDPSVMDAEFRAWVDSPSKSHEMGIFKHALYKQMRDLPEKVNKAYIRGLVKQFSIFTPIPSEFMKVSNNQDIWSSNKKVSINKTSRIAQWKQTTLKRIAEIVVDPAKQAEIRKAFAAMNLGEDVTTTDRATVSEFLEKLTGVNRLVFAGASDKFWLGMRSALVSEKFPNRNGA